MRRALIAFITTAGLAALMAACSGPQEPGGGNTTTPGGGDAKMSPGGEQGTTGAAATGDVCPSDLPPPKCPEGCKWDGATNTCRKHLGILQWDAMDGGADASGTQ